MHFPSFRVRRSNVFGPHRKSKQFVVTLTTIASPRCCPSSTFSLVALPIPAVRVCSPAVP
eukprot:11017853-Karenia_brevis.AAC.1